jgi:hypothetical protein
MSRLAQIRSAISDRPWQWVVYLLIAFYAALIFHLRLGGTLVAFVAISLFDRLFLSRFRRRRRGSELAEIGTVELEIAAWTPGSSGTKFFVGAFILFSILWLILLCQEAVTLVESYFHGVGEDSNLTTFVLQASIFAGFAASIGRNYRSRWCLLITDQGLFQVVDTKRLWPSHRSLDTSNSPLKTNSTPRAVFRRYPWEQIVRFHWGQQNGDPVLHLHVHQPGFGVPQLVSFPLPNLSREDWQKLDDLLRTHVSVMSSQEPDRALTTSATV